MLALGELDVGRRDRVIHIQLIDSHFDVLGDLGHHALDLDLVRGVHEDRASGLQALGLAQEVHRHLHDHAIGERHATEIAVHDVGTQVIELQILQKHHLALVGVLGAGKVQAKDLLARVDVLDRFAGFERDGGGLLAAAIHHGRQAALLTHALGVAGAESFAMLGRECGGVLVHDLFPFDLFNACELTNG
jgi:hypothetical protein